MPRLTVNGIFLPFGCLVVAEEDGKIDLCVCGAGWDGAARLLWRYGGPAGSADGVGSPHLAAFGAAGRALHGSVACS